MHSSGFLLPREHPVLLHWRLLRKPHHQMCLNGPSLDRPQPPEHQGFLFMKQRMDIQQLPIDQCEACPDLQTGHQCSLQAFLLSVRDLLPQPRALALFPLQSHQLQLHVQWQHDHLLRSKPVHLPWSKLVHLLQSKTVLMVPAPWPTQPL